MKNIRSLLLEGIFRFRIFLDKTQGRLSNLSVEINQLELQLDWDLAQRNEPVKPIKPLT